MQYFGQYFWIERIITLLIWACTTLVCIFFFSRRIHRLVPEFTNYILFSTAFFWTAELYFYYYALYHRTSFSYFYFHSACDLLQEFLVLLTIYLIFSRLLRGLPRFKSVFRFLPLISILCLSGVVLINSMLSNWARWTISKRLQFAHQNFVLLQCGLVFCTVLFALLAALPWERPLKGILGGFGVDSSLRLVAFAITAHNSKVWLAWPFGRVLMQTIGAIAPLVWLVVILRTPENKSRGALVQRQDVESYRSNLESWSASLGGLVYRLTRNVSALISSRMPNSSIDDKQSS
jgi:hypothetical protein